MKNLRFWTIALFVVSIGAVSSILFYSFAEEQNMELVRWFGVTTTQGFITATTVECVGMAALAVISLAISAAMLTASLDKHELGANEHKSEGTASLAQVLQPGQKERFHLPSLR